MEMAAEDGLGNGDSASVPGYGGAPSRDISRLCDHSAALAEKLLQGWTLLGEHCPQCMTPLVRNRQRKLYCVACAQWLLTESEAAARVLQERVEQTTKSEQIARTSHPLSESVAAVHDSVSQGLSNPAIAVQASESSRIILTDSTRATSLSGQIQDIPPDRNLENLASDAAAPNQNNSLRPGISDKRYAHANTSLEILKVDAPLNTEEAVLSRTLSVLVQKLEEIGSALAVSQNLHDIRQLFSALRECLQAIADVKAIAEA